MFTDKKAFNTATKSLHIAFKNNPKMNLTDFRTQLATEFTPYGSLEAFHASFGQSLDLQPDSCKLSSKHILEQQSEKVRNQMISEQALALFEDNRLVMLDGNQRLITEFNIFVENYLNKEKSEDNLNLIIEMFEDNLAFPYKKEPKHLISKLRNILDGGTINFNAKEMTSLLEIARTHDQMEDLESMSFTPSEIYNFFKDADSVELFNNGKSACIYMNDNHLIASTNGEDDVTIPYASFLTFAIKDNAFVFHTEDGQIDVKFHFNLLKSNKNPQQYRFVRVGIIEDNEYIEDNLFFSNGRLELSVKRCVQDLTLQYASNGDEYTNEDFEAIIEQEYENIGPRKLIISDHY